MLAMKTGKYFSARTRLERDLPDEPGENDGRTGAPGRPMGAGRAHAGRISRRGKVRVELALRYRAVAKSDLDGNIVQPAGREAAVEVPQRGNDYSDNGHPDVGAGLVQNKEIEALSLDEFDAGKHLRSVIELAEIGPSGGRICWTT